MNTIFVRPASKLHPMETLGWLVKREYWEHRGGFLWAPIIVGASWLGMMLLGVLSAEFTTARHGIQISGLHLDVLIDQMAPEKVQLFMNGLDIALVSLGIPIAIGLSFVMFFYLLGALYDDRRDRSILFWNSLPISDLNTVLSKVVAAVVVAPVLATLAIIALQIAVLVMFSFFSLIHGVNHLSLLWDPDHLFSVWTKLFVMIPINALWALPTVGWLLLCSSFARSKPFLLAVLLPTLAGLVVGYINIMQQFALPSSWYWKNVFGRIELSMIPGGWLFAGLPPADFFGLSESTTGINIGANGADALTRFLSWNYLLGVLTSPQLWIGAGAGAIMIVLATYIRRNRTEAYA